MTRKLIPTLLLTTFLLFASCGNQKTTSAPSIKDNSNHQKKEIVNDYSSVESSKLLRQVKAHYDLDQYDVAKDKVIHLLKTYQDSLDGTDLIELKQKIDVKLAEIQSKIQQKNRLAQNERLSTSLEKMRFEQKNGVTYYFDKQSPEFNTKECFYTYLKVKNRKPSLFFKVRYIGNDFLDIQDYMINVDKLDHIFNGEVVKSELKGKKNYKVELLDIEITKPEDFTKLEAIANGTEVTAVYVGANTYAKREISSEQKQSIQNVLDAYTFFKEKNRLIR